MTGPLYSDAGVFPEEATVAVNVGVSKDEEAQALICRLTSVRHTADPDYCHSLTRASRDSIFGILGIFLVGTILASSIYFILRYLL